ncbi:hypothetical protein LUW76_32040 [Actinomadura madurae]|uniref:hypothetical protein n=1 Tax=Actinomadura madurae TaxID=1993 RepID=UPI00202612B0|nr:hypothetical protein [Actinomadura madurae]URM98607.1 hypothetical protein LUW76_32040 [Actinomadura madurae]
MPAEATLLGLARGGGGEQAVRELRGAHLGRCMTLLRAVREAAEASAHPEAGMAAAGWTLLAALDRSHPDAVREVLAYPTVAVWARRTLTELARARASHPGRLACAAAVAAHRAGRDRAIQLPAEDGAVVLPGLGRAVMRGRPPPDPVPDGSGTCSWKTVNPVGRHCAAWRPDTATPASGSSLRMSTPTACPAPRP